MKLISKIYLVVIYILLISFSLNSCKPDEPAGLTASFTTDKESGNGPLKVKFTNTSPSDAVAFSWDFGDGTTSKEMSPEHTFYQTSTTSIKKYTVKLTVQNNSLDTASCVKTITVNVFIINPINFNNNLTYGSVSDIDGNVYKTIVIGTQTWMAENLRVTKFNNGTIINEVSDTIRWSQLIGIGSYPAYCWYNYEHQFKDTYGALYNSDARKENLCPSGWHIPSTEEWTTLTNFLGGEDVAGGKLKETGNNHWQDPNTGATNESGFTALPSGEVITYNPVSDYGQPRFLGEYAYFWSSSDYMSSGEALTHTRILTNLSEGIADGNNVVYFYGQAVRCIKN